MYKVMYRIEYEMKLRGIEYRDMAAAMCISVATYYTRRKDPSKLTLREIQLAAKKLHMTEAELLFGKAS